MPALGTARTVIARMINGSVADPVFTYTMPPVDPPTRRTTRLDAADRRTGGPPPWPTYIAVAVKVPAKGDLDATRAGSYTAQHLLLWRGLPAQSRGRQSPYNTGG